MQGAFHPRSSASGREQIGDGLPKQLEEVDDDMSQKKLIVFFIVFSHRLSQVESICSTFFYPCIEHIHP